MLRHSSFTNEIWIDWVAGLYFADEQLSPGTLPTLERNTDLVAHRRLMFPIVLICGY